MWSSCEKSPKDILLGVSSSDCSMFKKEGFSFCGKCSTDWKCVLVFAKNRERVGKE